ncbi:MAG: DsbA family protein [Pyrinomonadaceae bacterium]
MNNRLLSKLNMSMAILFLSIATTAVVDANGQAKQSLVVEAEAVTASSTPFLDDTEAIEKIVRNYLLKNPAVVREALQALQVQEQKEREERAANTMKELRNEIFSNPGSPVAGNAAGDVSIVVFFDYNCGYCKSTLPQLQALSQKDPLVRIVFKELPILGPQSLTAAKAALAAGRQGKYVEFHNALLTAESTNEDAIKNISKTLGLDYAKLQKDMADPKIEDQLARTSRLAGALDIKRGNFGEYSRRRTSKNDHVESR